MVVSVTKFSIAAGSIGESPHVAKTLDEDLIQRVGTSVSHYLSPFPFREPTRGKWTIRNHVTAHSLTGRLPAIRYLEVMRLRGRNQNELHLEGLMGMPLFCSLQVVRVLAH